jgi:ABC-type branched-subunit amino acid transport system permease subunit
MAELLVFPQPEVFGISSGGTIPVPPLALGPWQLASPRGLLIVTTAAFSLVGTALLALRHHAYGRRLIALRDSPAACSVLGIDINRTKLSVYALSAAVAGLGGALLATYRQQVGTGDFTMLASLPVVLLLVIGGITTISGALFGGLASVALLAVQSVWNLSFLQTLILIAPGLVAVGIGHTLNGAAPALGRALAGKRRTIPPAVLTDMGLARPLTDEELAAVEERLALPQEYRHDRTHP